ncbi:alkaline shock response membrane anchor protein AmaP, partial [Eubacteriales bacterium OttesenSCG-928-N13]|nr:alkaline shock response membrane anchor protein AmaP [Eubacteriales bacterium OttesenSCG-928-N13]
MKLKFRDRLLLALYAVIGILATLGLASAAYLALFGDLLHIKLGDVFYLSNDILSKTIIVALVLIMLAWSIWVLMLAFRHKPKLDKSSVSVQNTENGSVRISVQAMDVLVRQAIGNTEGVVDIKTRIINHEDSITVKVDMTLDSDVHIPNVTMLMQRSVKNFIEEYSGIAVREVTILVSKIIEVTPHPPLALESKGDKAPEIIDQPDAMEPDESATEAAA